MRRWVITVTMCSALAACPPLAPAQTGHDAGHGQFHDVYKHWRIPGTDSSCCNAKRTVDGQTIGDCYPVRAELRRSENPDIKGLVWWAESDRGVWVEVPDQRIIREANPDQSGEAGHLRESQVDFTILCFRPPITGN